MAFNDVRYPQHDPSSALAAPDPQLPLLEQANRRDGCRRGAIRQFRHTSIGQPNDRQPRQPEFIDQVLGADLGQEQIGLT